MSKSFTHAGVSRLNGEFKVRFASDSTRVKVLMKNGHRDIDLIELIHPMTKEEAVAYLISIDFDNGNTEVRAALEDAQTKRAPKEPKKAKPSIEGIRAKGKAKHTPAAVEETADTAPEDEEAPF